MVEYQICKSIASTIQPLLRAVFMYKERAFDLFAALIQLKNTWAFAQIGIKAQARYNITKRFTHIRPLLVPAPVHRWWLNGNPNDTCPLEA